MLRFEIKNLKKQSSKVCELFKVLSKLLSAKHRTFRSKRIQTHNLRTRMSGLKNLICGSSLMRSEQILNDIDTHLDALERLIYRVYGEDAETKLTCKELKYIRFLSKDKRECMQCKRALLLFAMHNEMELAEHYYRTGGRDDQNLVIDLQTRILPLLMPYYVRDLCQGPDYMVNMAIIINQMWGGESFDSFDSFELDTATRPSGNSASVQIANALAPPPDGSMLM